MNKNRFGILSLILFFPYGLFYMWKNNLWSVKVRYYISFFYAIIVVSSFFNTSNKSSNEVVNYATNLSASETLLGYDWCYPHCEDPVAAYKFHSEGTFYYSTKVLGVGTREGKWIDKGDGEVDLVFFDGNGNSSLIIESFDQFNIGTTIYLRY